MSETGTTCLRDRSGESGVGPLQGQRPAGVGGRVLTALAAGAFLVAGGFLAGCAVKPDPLEPEEVYQIVVTDREVIAESQVPVSGTLSMAEAKARAVAYNLEHRTRQVEAALARGQLDLAQFDMLPVLAASAGVRSRSNIDGSTSNYLDGLGGSERPTTSSDQTRYTADLRFSYNLLDFGVGWLQARQQADRYLISQGSRAQLLQRLMHQTRVAYTRAAAAQALRPDVEQMLEETRLTLDDLTRLQEARLEPPITTLQSRRALIEVLGQLEAIEQSLALADLELKAIINIDPVATVQLETPETLLDFPDIRRPVEDLELLALTNSSEVKEQIYSARIERLESHKALLRLLPGIDLGLSGNFDSNSFLVNNTWAEASAQISWNLMQLASAPAIRDLAETRENLATVRRLALNMAVISRLHVAVRRYMDSVTQLRRAEELDSLEAEIARHAGLAVQADAGSRVERIRSEASALRARLRYFEAYANSQDALGGFFVSLGLNPVPEDFAQIPVEELTRHIAAQMDAWERGDLPELVVPEPAAEKEEGNFWDLLSMGPDDRLPPIGGVALPVMSWSAPGSLYPPG